VASEASRRIDLNADVGEGLPPEVDRSLMEVVTSASIACGGHAGDPDTMRRTLDAARELGIRVGAHPSYPDREGFGRRAMDVGPKKLRASIEQQVSRLCDVAAKCGVEVAYLKPHGALYNDAVTDPSLLGLLLDTSHALGLPLMLLGGAVDRLVLREESLAGGTGAPSHLTAAAVLDGREIWRRDLGAGRLRLPIAEGFVDRAYGVDGTLVPRGHPGALITDRLEAAGQAVGMAESVDSLCVHSDSPSALDLIKAARGALEAAGYEVGP
jgi:5-oxoprolinase (ATP-hydrolysing) subunit A